jgi:hypothetical protein
LKRVRFRSLIKNLLKVRKLLIVLKAQSMLFKVNMMYYKRHINILKCNLMLFDQAPLINQAIPKLPKPLQVKDVKDVIILILMLFMLKANILILSKCL